MQKTKIVKEVLLEYMQNKGYSYQYDQEMWIFEKWEEKLKKTIFVMDVHRESIKFVFATNAYGQKQIEGIDFVDKQKVRINGLRCCMYENEEDIRQIMYEVKRVIEEKGDEIFAEISEPTTDAIPTPELQKQLFDNHEELESKGEELLDIKNKQGKDRITALVERLKWTGQIKVFPEIKDELIILSAVFGEICREQSQGEWVYQENYCYVKIKKYALMLPLNMIFMAWESNDFRNLYYYYDLAAGKYR